MLFFILGGIATFTSIKTEVFPPSIDKDEVVISVAYTGGASPPSEVVEGGSYLLLRMRSARLSGQIRLYPPQERARELLL